MPISKNNPHMVEVVGQCDSQSDTMAISKYKNTIHKSESCELHSHWVGVSKHVGHQMMFIIKSCHVSQDHA